jgi:hypothetical protein
MDHSAVICNGVESVNIVATVTGTALLLVWCWRTHYRIQNVTTNPNVSRMPPKTNNLHGTNNEAFCVTVTLFNCTLSGKYPVWILDEAPASNDWGLLQFS